METDFDRGLQEDIVGQLSPILFVECGIMK